MAPDFMYACYSKKLKISPKIRLQLRRLDITSAARNEASLKAWGQHRRSPSISAYAIQYFSKFVMTWLAMVKISTADNTEAGGLSIMMISRSSPPHIKTLQIPEPSTYIFAPANASIPRSV